MNIRIPAFVAVLALGAAGCSSGDDSADSTAPSVTAATTATTSVAPTTSMTTSTTSTTSTSSSTTAVPSTSATTTPPTTTSVDPTDWVAVVQTLGQRRQGLYAAPDVTRVGEVCAAASPCAEQLNVQLADLASKGWRVADAEPYTVVSADLEDFDGDSLDTALVATVIVVVQRPGTGGSIVDSSGAVVAGVDPETDEGVNTENRTTLGRSGPVDDPWRIISQERIREVPG